MRIAHTKILCLFREVTVVEQALVQRIVATVKKAYLPDIHNCTNNYINDTVVDVLTHLQDNCGQLIPHELLKRKDVVKKEIYNPRELMATVLLAVG